jgi:lipopolysaccharide export system protein LptA
MKVKVRSALAGLTTALVVAAPAGVKADPFSAVGGDAATVQADRLDVDVATGDATLEGNVTLTKGDLKVACPKIQVKFDHAPQVKWARGSGGVTADVRGVHAEAPEVELDLAKHSMELRGGVKLTRGNGWLQAEKATIDIATAKVTLQQVKGSIPVPPKPK